jgi:hypothetical protein
MDINVFDIWMYSKIYLITEKIIQLNQERENHKGINHWVPKLLYNKNITSFYKSYQVEAGETNKAL